MSAIGVGKTELKTPLCGGVKDIGSKKLTANASCYRLKWSGDKTLDLEKIGSE